MKKVNFKELDIQDIEGKTIKTNIAKELGNLLYMRAENLSTAELGRAIYKDGEVEVSEDLVNVVCQTAKANFIYPVWSAIEKLLK